MHQDSKLENRIGGQPMNVELAKLWDEYRSRSEDDPRPSPQSMARLAELLTRANGSNALDDAAVDGLLKCVSKRRSCSRDSDPFLTVCLQRFDAVASDVPTDVQGNSETLLSAVSPHNGYAVEGPIHIDTDIGRNNSRVRTALGTFPNVSRRPTSGPQRWGRRLIACTLIIGIAFGAFYYYEANRQANHNSVVDGKGDSPGTSTRPGADQDASKNNIANQSPAAPGDSPPKSTSPAHAPNGQLVTGPRPVGPGESNSDLGTDRRGDVGGEPRKPNSDISSLAPSSSGVERSASSLATLPTLPTLPTLSDLPPDDADPSAPRSAMGDDNPGQKLILGGNPQPSQPVPSGSVPTGFREWALETNDQVRWKTRQPTPGPGKYQLQKGRATLMFPDGTELQFRGPAEILVESSAGPADPTVAAPLGPFQVVIEYGDVHVRMPRDGGPHLRMPLIDLVNQSESNLAIKATKNSSEILFNQGSAELSPHEEVEGRPICVDAKQIRQVLAQRLPVHQQTTQSVNLRRLKPTLYVACGDKTFEARVQLDGRSAVLQSPNQVTRLLNDLSRQNASSLTKLRAEWKMFCERTSDGQPTAGWPQWLVDFQKETEQELLKMNKLRDSSPHGTFMFQGSLNVSGHSIDFTDPQEFLNVIHQR